VDDAVVTRGARPRWLVWIDRVTKVLLVVAVVPIVLGVVGAAFHRHWATLVAGLILIMVSGVFVTLFWPSPRRGTDDHP
jgi:uncharacterized membrane protein YccC